MTQIEGIWRVATPLRWIANLTLVAYGIYLACVIMGPYFGEAELAYTFVRLENLGPVALWKLLIIDLCCVALFYGVYKAVRAANRFISLTQKNGFLIDGVALMCEGMGIGLLIYWLAATVRRNFIPYLLDPDRGIMEEGAFLPLGLLNAHMFLILMIGIVLLLVSRAMETARIVAHENKQFI